MKKVLILLATLLVVGSGHGMMAKNMGQKLGPYTWNVLHPGRSLSSYHPYPILTYAQQQREWDDVSKKLTGIRQEKNEWFEHKKALVDRLQRSSNPQHHNVNYLWKIHNPLDEQWRDLSLQEKIYSQYLYNLEEQLKRSK
ncbi:hypothetical protein HOM50_00135 [bacterium]|jgi:hypothetical protein|nr:hypothetical protein [bacterium]MBT5014804.1 hypothetical protein [bacterium]